MVSNLHDKFHFKFQKPDPVIETMICAGFAMSFCKSCKRDSATLFMTVGYRGTCRYSWLLIAIYINIHLTISQI